MQNEKLKITVQNYVFRDVSAFLNTIVLSLREFFSLWRNLETISEASKELFFSGVSRRISCFKPHKTKILLPPLAGSERQIEVVGQPVNSSL